MKAWSRVGLWFGAVLVVTGCESVPGSPYGRDSGVGDLGVRHDGGDPDGGRTDSGPPDSGSPDGGIDDGGNPDDGGPTDAGPDDAGGSTITLPEGLGGTLNMYTQDTPRVTVRTVAANDDTAYMVDGETIVAWRDEVYTTYLGESALGALLATDIRDLQVLPTGELLLLDFNVGVLWSNNPGHVEVLFAFDGGEFFGAVNDEAAYVADSTDVYEVTATGATQLYPLTSLGHGTSCTGGGAAQDLEASGEYLFYLPGCASSSLYIAALDGSGVGVLLSIQPLRDDLPVSILEPVGFGSISPAGDGVVVNLGGQMIFVTRFDGHRSIPITPSLHLDPFNTNYELAPIDVSSNGRIWMVFVDAVAYVD